MIYPIKLFCFHCNYAVWVLEQVNEQVAKNSSSVLVIFSAFE